VDGVSVYVTAAVGFCLSSRTPETNGAAWAQATSTALREAQKRGPSTIRAYTEEMRRVSQARAELREEVGAALDGGQITPWYQPQISTDTGNVTGFEALARWHHPERGMIAPADFLPAIEQAGLLERLAEVMMYHSFTAQKAWDASGVAVPQVGVNFSGAELNNPRLVENDKMGNGSVQPGTTPAFCRSVRDSNCEGARRPSYLEHKWAGRIGLSGRP
jgi:predicted signal transduction protein with EAL and GGDEF domain